MINKFYKVIHNKYLKFFKFIFFLRYLVAIFFISSSLFLVIPMFLNNENRAETIKKNLFENYDLDIINYERIKFYPLPLPRYELKNVKTNFSKPSLNFSVQNLLIYPKILSIYNQENFQTNKIVLKNNSITLKTSSFKSFINKIFNQEKKLSLENLALDIEDEKKSILKLEDIKFSNYGYNHNLITGKIFGKKFKIKIKNNFKNFIFKIINSGINADINYDYFDKLRLKKGIFKSKILNTNLKFNFEHDNKELKIHNLFFRSKNFSFSNNSLIIFSPFLEFNSQFIVEEFNVKILNELDFLKLIKSKNFIKKINSKNQISFKSNKFINNLIKEINFQIDLAYGIMNFSKKFLISNNIFKCDGNLNLLDEFPLLFFNCNFNINDKKKLLKHIAVKTKNKDNKVLKINTKGNLNILSKKINFKEILINDDFSSPEDLKYFKNTFENIFFDKSVFEIFELKKIRKFITELS